MAEIDKQNYFEGDILLGGSKMGQRAGLPQNNKYIWPDQTIPYHIQEEKYGILKNCLHFLSVQFSFCFYNQFFLYIFHVKPKAPLILF